MTNLYASWKGKKNHAQLPINDVREELNMFPYKCLLLKSLQRKNWGESESKIDREREIKERVGERTLTAFEKGKIKESRTPKLTRKAMPYNFTQSFN